MWGLCPYTILLGQESYVFLTGLFEKDIIFIFTLFMFFFGEYETQIKMTEKSNTEIRPCGKVPKAKPR